MILCRGYLRHYLITHSQYQLDFYDMTHVKEFVESIHEYISDTTATTTCFYISYLQVELKHAFYYIPRALCNVKTGCIYTHYALKLVPQSVVFPWQPSSFTPWSRG